MKSTSHQRVRPEAISIRDFARRDGCSDTHVRRGIRDGRLSVLPDGRLDARLVGSDWRPRRKKATNDDVHDAAAELAAEVVERIARNGPTHTLAQAQCIKENFLAGLRGLQFDRQSGAVAEIADIAAAVTTEYGVIRAKLLSLPAKVAPLLVGLPDPNQLKAILDVEVARVLDELSLDAGGRQDRAEQEIARRFTPLP